MTELLFQNIYPKFRPMLSATLETEDDVKGLTYPQFCSYKLDGIRVLLHPQLGPVTRKLIPLPNRYARSILADPKLWYLDGEIIVGDVSDKNGFNENTQSGVMSHGGNPDFAFYIFDCFKSPTLPYRERLKDAKSIINAYQSDAGNLSRIRFVSQWGVADHLGVMMFEDDAIERGYEGLMVRSPTAPYKFGRSTLKQQWLMKLKRFTDAEAVIVGFEPLEKNTNEPVKDHLGLQKRSSHQAGKVEMDTLGKILVQAAPWGQFSIGSGFDQTLRKEIWQNQDNYRGKTVTFKYLGHGTKDKPRHPIFLRFRYD